MIRLEVTRGQLTGKRVESSADTFRIGRAGDSDLALPDDHVSSDHARILLKSDRYVLCDLRSTNGTVVVRKGERITLDDTNGREVPLEAEDAIELGSGDQLV